jgi:hypothetical protein
VRGEDATDGWGRPVSVWLREGRARAASARAKHGQAGLRAEFLGRSRHSVDFLFLFMQISFVCLNLIRKSYMDSKIMEIFV